MTEFTYLLRSVLSAEPKDYCAFPEAPWAVQFSLLLLERVRPVVHGTVHGSKQGRVYAVRTTAKTRTT
jgi:hypothetical protein